MSITSTSIRSNMVIVPNRSIGLTPPSIATLRQDG